MSSPGVNKQPGVIDRLLTILQLATTAAEVVPGFQMPAEIALQFEKIAAAANQAHEQITGQPFDASKIPAIDPV